MNAANGRSNLASATVRDPRVVPSGTANGTSVSLALPVYARRFTQAHRAIMPNDRFLGDAIRADREAGRYGR